MFVVDIYSTDVCAYSVWKDGLACFSDTVLRRTFRGKRVEQDTSLISFSETPPDLKLSCVLTDIYSDKIVANKSCRENEIIFMTCLFPQ